MRGSPLLTPHFPVRELPPLVMHLITLLSVILGQPSRDGKIPGDSGVDMAEFPVVLTSVSRGSKEQEIPLGSGQPPASTGKGRVKAEEIGTFSDQVLL